MLDIRTAQLDETTQVGVIELKTCIQAIVSASPELVAKLGQDYTVYAYDYSEYETPLVGQGMLSWVLASSSATPSAPAHQSRTMVTGRVCKNLLLFGSNSEDTLEVKLRLVPVPTALQSEYIESMNKYRELSNIIPPGFDMASWTSFVQANPGLMNLVQPEANTPQGAGAVQREGVGIEHVQRLMNEQNSSQAPDPPISKIQSPQRLSFQAGDQIQRPSSAASSVQSTHAAKKRGRPPKRPTSQASIQRRAPSKPAENPQHSFAESGYVSNDDRAEEGPTRKRAKVSQADWPSSTNLGKQPDSLRVAASTAASVRVMQPQPIRPTPPSVKSLEPPPRAPTPVAKAGPLIRRPPLPTARSSLRRESILQNEDNYQSPYPTSEAFPKSPDYAIASPGDSAKDSSGTPMEMGSSPPVFPRVFEASSSPDISPQTDFLPNLDSGFVSGSIEDLFNDDNVRPLDAEDFDVAAQCSKRPEPDFQLPSVEPEPEPQLPRVSRMISDADQLIPKGPPPVDDNTTCDQPNNSATPTVGPQALQRTASTSDIGQQAPQKEKKQVLALRRTQTWSEAQAAPPSSDGTVMGDTKASGKPSKYRPRSDSGSGAKRKRAVQNKLAKALAAGQMPPFCEHCGAIETPTWRKAWVKLYSGTPTNVQLSVEEGGVVTWQPLETNENGIITLYRVVKKTILPTDEGFNEILLCNRKIWSSPSLYEY